MPVYRVTDPTTGKTAKLTGDSPPTEQELEEIFGQLGGQQETASAQTEQTTAPQQQPSLMQAAEGVLAPLPSREFSDPEYWKQNVPQSLARLPVAAAAGMGSMAMGVAREFTDPFMNLLGGKASLGEAARDLWNAPKEATQGVINELAEFTAAPLGLAKNTTASQAWDDPAAAIMALSPFGKPALKGAKAVLPSKVALNLTRKSLKFTPSIDPALQKKVAETVQKNGANVTEAGLDKFKQDLKAKNRQVAETIEPVGDTPIEVDISSVYQARLKKAETSGTKGKDVKAAEKYIKTFVEDHLLEGPLTVAKAQKIKQNINFQLKEYYKAKSKSGKTKDAKAETMQEISDTLRSEIERFAPETKQLNTEIHDMIVARPFLQSATNKAGNQPVIATRDFIAGYAAGEMIAPGMHLPAMLASKALRDSRVQGRAGIALYDLGQFTKKVKGMLKPTEAAKIVQEIEPQLAEIQGQGQLPPGQNQLALPAPGKAMEMGMEPRPQINLGEGANRPVVVNSIERLFQIAQSPEGKRLLVEKLGRQELHARLVTELLKVPDKNLMRGQWPLVKTDAKVYNVNQKNALSRPSN